MTAAHYTDADLANFGHGYASPIGPENRTIVAERDGIGGRYVVAKYERAGWDYVSAASLTTWSVLRVTVGEETARRGPYACVATLRTRAACVAEAERLAAKVRTVAP